MHKYLLKKHTLCDVDGIKSETTVISTESDNNMVNENPILSPLSMGNANTNGPITVRSRTGITMFNK